jgi:exosortase A
LSAHDSDAHAAARLADVASVEQRRTALVAAALVLVGFALLWPTTASLMTRWEDTVHRTYTHGYLVALLSTWLIWRERKWLAPAHTFAPAAGALVLAAILWLIAWRAGLQIVHQALLPAMILAAVLTCCGGRVTRQLAVPIGYLYCAIPIWDALNPILQSVSVFAVRMLLRISGIPAYFSGNRFQIPAGSFEIADGCSGLHFFIVALSVSVLYGAINRDRWTMRLKLVAFALALAMLTNWLRIYVIVLAGHLTDMQHRLIRGEHYSFGWYVFAGAMLLFFLVVRRWPLTPTEATTESSAQSAPAPAAIGLAVLALAIAPVWNLLDGNRAASASPHALSHSIAGWSVQEGELTWNPVLKGADIKQHVAYRAQDVTVDAFVATYLWQQQGKEFVGYGNSVLGDMTALRERTEAPAPWRVTRARDAQGEEWLVLHTRRIDDRWYASAIEAQLAYGFRSLFQAPLSSMIALRSPCKPDCTQALDGLLRFVAGAGWPGAPDYEAPGAIERT